MKKKIVLGLGILSIIILCVGCSPIYPEVYDDCDKLKIEELWASDINELTIEELDYLISFCMVHLDYSPTAMMDNTVKTDPWLNWAQVYQNEKIQRLLSEK